MNTKLAALLFILTFHAQLIAEAVISQIPMGGGGYVTNIVVHPADPSIRYLRTDVGGTYHWDEACQKWVQMSWSMGKDYKQYCTDGIAIDPQDPAVVYICVGDGSGTGVPGIYKSTNNGQTWTLLRAAPFFGNSCLSHTGECIQVDPRDSRVLAVGTRGAGLLMTHDGGETWSTAKDVPANYTYPGENFGIRSIVFDDSRLTADGRSAVIYASLYRKGVYATSDGGETWQLLNGSPNPVRRLALSSDGTLYMTSEDGVWRYRDGKFTDISPSVPKRAYNALAVDRTHPGRLIVCHDATSLTDCMNRNIYLSDDDGQTWTQKNIDIRKHDQPAWWPDYYWSSATASLCFHPQDSRQVWLTDWYGVWYTPNIDADIVDWYAKVKGHEECVTFSAATLPCGPVKLLMGTVDNGLLYYPDITQYPPRRSSSTYDICDIAWCAAHPESIVIATAKPDLLVSKDYGMTQNALPTPLGNINRVAVSADDPNHWVVLPTQKVPHYTLDGGKTWNASNGVTPNLMDSKWALQFILAADGVDGAVFYYSDKDGLYRSQDGGATFSRVNDTIQGYAVLYPQPGQRGKLCLLHEKKLFSTSDGGATLRPVEFFATVSSFACGKGLVAGTLAWYAIGEPADSQSPAGLYLSDNEGSDWRLVRESKDLSLFGLVCGDMQTYGRCFMTACALGAIVVEAQ